MLSQRGRSRHEDILPLCDIVHRQTAVREDLTEKQQENNIEKVKQNFYIFVLRLIEYVMLWRAQN